MNPKLNVRLELDMRLIGKVITNPPRDHVTCVPRPARAGPISAASTAEACD